MVLQLTCLQAESPWSLLFLVGMNTQLPSLLTHGIYRSVDNHTTQITTFSFRGRASD